MYSNNLYHLLKPSDKPAIIDYNDGRIITYNQLIEMSSNLNIESGFLLHNEDDYIELIIKLFASFKSSVNPQDTAFTITTSGTTGIPKSISYTHERIYSNLKLVCSKIRNDDRVLIIASLSHMNGLSNLLISLFCNHTVYVTRKFDVAKVIDCIQTNNITKITTVPTVFEYLTKHSFENKTVRNIRVASSLCKKELIVKIKKIFPNSTIFNAYGISEVGPGLFGYHPHGKQIPDGSVGYPLPNYSYKIQDGVLKIKTPSMTEYFNTNDLFTVDKDGFYYCHGRVDELFKCGGYTINPTEVETEIEKVAGVKKAIVIPVADDVKENKPICIIICDIDTEGINSQLNLSEYKKPRRYIKVDDFPLNAAGKVDRKTLREIYG